MNIQKMSIVELKKQYNILGHLLFDRPEENNADIYEERIRIRREIRIRIESEKLSHTQRPYAKVSPELAERLARKGIIFDSV